jgi:hypothetical protein
MLEKRDLWKSIANYRYKENKSDTFVFLENKKVRTKKNKCTTILNDTET